MPTVAIRSFAPPLRSALLNPAGLLTPPWAQWFTQVLSPNLASALQELIVTGDVKGTSNGESLTLNIQPKMVTLTKMADLAATSILGNNTASPATPVALTPAQVVVMLPAGGDLSGTYDAPQVTGLKNKAIPTLSSGLFGYNGASWYFTTSPDMSAYKVSGVQVLGAQQTGLGTALISKTAAGTYSANEQTMLQQAHDKIRILEGLLRAHGMVTT